MNTDDIHASYEARLGELLQSHDSELFDIERMAIFLREKIEKKRVEEKVASIKDELGEIYF